MTQTGTAILTIKLITMTNIFSAFTAFYSTIDKLKHMSSFGELFLSDGRVP